MSEKAADVTKLLQAWSLGDQSALNQLVPLVERELRRLARGYMARERKGHTLQPTALVNEVFLRLSEGGTLHYQNRAHFIGIAAKLMRRVLVDHARARGFKKRGGGAAWVPLEEGLLSGPAPDVDVVALDRALTTFATIDPRKSQVVELRFFGGLSVEETADALEVSTDTVKRDWRLARRWLIRELTGDAVRSERS